MPQIQPLGDSIASFFKRYTHTWYNQHRSLLVNCKMRDHEMGTFSGQQKI